MSSTDHEPDRYFLWIAAGVGVAFCALAVVLVVTLVILMGGL